MYAGTTLTRFSGRLFGAHQKIDRVARRHLNKITVNGRQFPDIRSILQFEGKNGPDGIKRKSPARDEPWHFYQPFASDSEEFFRYIQEHYDQLVKELKRGNHERSAFEAAWLAHAIVDGLTPAHHFPFEEQLTELRGGKGLASRSSLKEKWLMHGATKRERLKNNWKMWGPKGLITSHGFFEFGVASIIKPLRFGEALPSAHDMKQIQAIGVVEWFRRAAREIGVLDMFGSYHEKGWTPKLALQVRSKLGPVIVQTVTLAWYSAMVDAGLCEGVE